MPQLLVRKVDERVIVELRARAARHGRSVEAEHREVLREALLDRRRKPDLKEYLLSMPDVGGDELFVRQRDRPRPVKL